MDEIDDFFNISKDFKRESAPVPKPIIEPAATTSRKVKRERDSPEPRKLPKVSKAELLNKSKQYKYTNWISFISKLEPKNEKPSNSQTNRFKFKGLPEECMNTIDDEAEDDFRERQNAHLNIDDGVYDRYVFNMERDTSLPIHDAKDEILKTIRQNPVVILEGDTGCGKTTQAST